MEAVTISLESWVRDAKRILLYPFAMSRRCLWKCFYLIDIPSSSAYGNWFESNSFCRLQYVSGKDFQLNLAKSIAVKKF